MPAVVSAYTILPRVVAQLTLNTATRPCVPRAVASSRAAHLGATVHSRARLPSVRTYSKRLHVRMGPPIPPSADFIGHTVGKGKHQLAVYLDYTCPFSGKMYNMLFGQLRRAPGVRVECLQVAPLYADKLRVTFYHQVQPWHPQSTLAHEAALAVAKVAGEDAFWKFSALLFDNMEALMDVNTIDMSRRQIYTKLAEMAESVGVDKSKVMAQLQLNEEAIANGQKNPGNAVTQSLKWEIKASRQMSIHVSPTTSLNGLLYDTSSGWTLDQWKELLDPLE